MRRIIFYPCRRCRSRRVRRRRGDRYDIHRHEQRMRRRAAAPATLSTMTTSLGTVLTNAQGFTLYYFLPEKNSTIGACTGGCLTAWPPLVATGTPSGPSALTGTLGTVSVMVNGAAENEVTYNGWPLHTYASDTAPGSDQRPGHRRQLVRHRRPHNGNGHRHELDDIDAGRSTRDADCEHRRRLWILTLTKCERLPIHRPELGPDRAADRHPPRDRRRVHRHHELDRAGARHRCRALRTGCPR